MATSYDQGYAWKDSEIGKEIMKFLHDKGIIMVPGIWQARGFPRHDFRMDGGHLHGIALSPFSQDFNQ